MRSDDLLHPSVKIIFLMLLIDENIALPTHERLEREDRALDVAPIRQRKFVNAAASEIYEFTVGSNLQRHAIIARDIYGSKHINRMPFNNKSKDIRFLEKGDEKTAKKGRTFVDSFEGKGVPNIHKKKFAGFTTSVPIKPVYKRKGFFVLVGIIGGYWLITVILTIVLYFMFIYQSESEEESTDRKAEKGGDAKAEGSTEKIVH